MSDRLEEVLERMATETDKDAPAFAGRSDGVELLREDAKAVLLGIFDEEPWFEGGLPFEALFGGKKIGGGMTVCFG